MSDKDKKLNFDLGFLDEESLKSKQPINKTRPKPESKRESLIKWNWKTISTIVGVIVLIIWLASSEDSSKPTSAYTPPSTNQVGGVSDDNDFVEYGEYRCSLYHYNKAVEMDPSESEPALKSAQLSLELRANEIERLGNELKYNNVTEYSSQWEIDNYNTDVNTYNSKLAAYQRDATALDPRIDRFNTQVEAHNRYLIQNCTPR